MNIEIIYDLLIKIGFVRTLDYSIIYRSTIKNFRFSFIFAPTIIVLYVYNENDKCLSSNIWHYDDNVYNELNRYINKKFISIIRKQKIDKLNINITE